MVGLREGGAVGGEGALLVGAEGDVERRGGGGGELVLDGEHVADWRGDGARGEGARLAGRFVRLADGVGRVDQVAVAGERERQCGGGAEFLRGLRGRGDLPVFERAGREDSDVVVDTEIGEALGERFGEAAAEGGEFGVLYIGDGRGQHGEGSGGDGGGCGCGGPQWSRATLVGGKENMSLWR